MKYLEQKAKKKHISVTAHSMRKSVIYQDVDLENQYFNFL